MQLSYRIAVLEDNPSLREELLELLAEQQWTAEGFSLAEDFTRAHRARAFDLLLLDLGLPDMDGLEVARQLSRAQDEVAIIILSARSSLDSRVSGLLEGADAFVAKPFEHAELLGYITALLRRRNKTPAKDTWRLQMDSLQLHSPEDGVSVALTVPESRLIRALAIAQPDPLPRLDMIQALEEDYRLYDERRLEKLVSRLRHKLLDYYASCPLKAVRGKGYVFSEKIRCE